MFSRISYKALLAKDHTGLVERAPNGWYVWGRLDARREVAKAYYDSKVGVGKSPLAEFQECPTTPEAILAFTRKWGPLRYNDADLGSLSTYLPTDEQVRASVVTSDSHFIFSVDEWLTKQAEFRTVCDLFRNPNLKMKQEAARSWPHWALFGARSAGYYISPDFGLSRADLHSWVAAGVARDVKHARSLAEKIGLYVPSKDGEMQFTIVAVSLWDALWLMLATDLSANPSALRKCARDECQMRFVLGSANQRYCSARCAQLAASLAYYYRSGKANRTRKRESPPS